MSGCPVCGDYRADSLCPNCTRFGFAELACGCIERPDGTRDACSVQHMLCDECGDEARQHGDHLCGPCRFNAEREYTAAIVKRLTASEHGRVTR